MFGVIRFLYKQRTALFSELLDFSVKQLGCAVEFLCKTFLAEKFRCSSVYKLFGKSLILGCKLASAVFAKAHFMSTTFAR